MGKAKVNKIKVEEIIIVGTKNTSLPFLQMMNMENS